MKIMKRISTTFSGILFLNYFTKIIMLFVLSSNISYNLTLLREFFVDNINSHNQNKPAKSLF
jgi:hypothetical protein